MSSVALTSRYGSVGEIASHLGISTKSVRRMYGSGRLKVHRINRRILISFEEVETLLRRSVRQVTQPPGLVPSALTPEGRAYPYSTAEIGSRVRNAVATLDFLASDDFEEDQTDADQAASLNLILHNIRANRGEI